ncbi:MAG: AbrB/MazE/SpoVT family DNA-binding domain-containing protein [Nitrococcus sp.]|nr:AbrB/MazE/SpoVT family DNA-binding domain-containing protein [Nitrococcus sp.]
MNAIVAERGQVTIPKRLRDQLGIVPGTVLEFAVRDGCLVATKRADDHPALKLLGRHGRGRRTADILAELRGKDA